MTTLDFTRECRAGYTATAQRAATNTEEKCQFFSVSCCVSVSWYDDIMEIFTGGLMGGVDNKVFIRLGLAGLGPGQPTLQFSIFNNE